MNAAKRIDDYSVVKDSSPPVTVPNHPVVDDDRTVGYVIDGGEHDGTYYLISPSENADGEWKYPVESCADAEDAWKLRNHGNFESGIDLAARIKRRANDIGCNGMPWEDTDNDSMTDNCDCGTKNMSEDSIELGVSALTVDAVRERNANVDERMDELEAIKRELQGDSEDLESAREALDIDDDASVASAIKALQEHAQELDEELSAYKDAELDSLRESVCDASEYEMDELADMDKEQLSIIADALDHSGVVSDDADGSDDDESTLKVATNDASESMNSSSRSTGFDEINYDRQIE